MILPQFFESPFKFRLSFDKIIERFEALAAAGEGLFGVDVKAVLKEVAQHPELRDGISDISQIKDNAPLIGRLMTELFPPPLTLNEIKAISVPYQGLIFNYSERFRNILHDAGPGFEINIRDFDDHQYFISCCCMILNEFYNTKVDFSKPLFYDIPTASGIIKHYRILYNADFMEILPTERAPTFSADEIKELLDNYDDLALWKRKFPADAWIVKGFSIMSLVDVTVQNAVSIFKDNLFGNLSGKTLQESLSSIFSSIFQITNVRVGFTLYDDARGKFHNVFNKKMPSFILSGEDEVDADKICEYSHNNLVEEHKYFAVADVPAFLANDPENKLARNFLVQGVNSFVLAPVVKDGLLLGILELGSDNAGTFNSVNANKLIVVMPYLVDGIDRKMNELQNLVRAVIQNNYTTLHPSVNWKFEREAQNYITSTDSGIDYHLKHIVFKKVYPLYGEVDIQNSSITRNLSIKSDLELQIDQLLFLLERLNNSSIINVAEQQVLILKEFTENLSAGVKADTEQYIEHYLDTYIHPLLKSANELSAKPVPEIEEYLNETNNLTGGFYLNRRHYEQTIVLVNNKLSSILDKRQTDIQQFFPHYYERFKTDGVEHNLYIGSSIAPDEDFDALALKRLRLWQLLVTAEMAMEQHRLKAVLPYPLGVTTLILVFSTPIDIRFRMDEKHFDIDGAYSVRYEVMKKRIDKAHIKNTSERITQRYKLTIVYSKVEEAEEYVGYISLMQAAGILASDLEHFEVEELQGVAGLKALRVGIVDNHDLLLGFDLLYEKLYRMLA